jgi:prepilin-type N-terminal cleavage/methylation domain-containing protein/prepilin-type processing-associated H-X9-DG protein
MTRLRHSAFSFIELLVVISIIGILIGILLPALSGAMARAREVKCLGQCQQIVVALISYAESNRSHYPMVPVPANVDPRTNQYMYGGLAGFFSLQQVGDGVHLGFGATGSGMYANGATTPILDSYLSTLGILVCPSDREDRYYGMPYSPTGNLNYAIAVPLRPRAPVAAPDVISYNVSYLYFPGRRSDQDTMVIWADETNGPDLNAFAWYGDPATPVGGTTANSTAAGAAAVGLYAPIDNHGHGGGNAAFTDGHARFLSRRYFSGDGGCTD